MIRMSNDFFPLQAAVLSEDALGNYIKSEYFSQNTLLTCRLFYRSIHDIYQIISSNEVFFYKLYRQGLREKAEIQAEVDLLNHLKLSDIQAVYPIAKKDGAYIGQFKTVFGNRYGVLYASVGVYNLDEIEETAQLNEKLGSYVASVHRAMDEFNIKLNRHDLDAHHFIDASISEIMRFAEIYNFDTDFLNIVAEKTKEKLRKLSTSKPEFGICHGDFYGGNVRINENNNPVLFDFDFCGNGWRAYDISMYAYPFSMGCDPSKFGKREQRKSQFLNGYNKLRPMSESEISSIVIFIPFRRIFNIGTLYISLLHNTWGDFNVVRNIEDDIINLKKWLDINPVL